MSATTPTSTSSSISSISSLCGSLESSTVRAVEALRKFVIYYPPARLDLTSLSRELAEVQMVARLLRHNAESLDVGTATLPVRLEAALRGVVQKASALLEETDDALDPGRKPEDRTPAWLEYTAERLSPLGRLAESLRTAMNLGLDVILLAINSQPNDGERELPGYNSSQILQEALNLRSRLREDSDSEDFRVQSQRPILSEYVEAIQEFIERTSTASADPPPPPPPDGENIRQNNSSTTLATNPGTTGSSLHSEADEPPIPDYNAIGITNPTPLRISLRHLAKKELSNHEVVEVKYVFRHNQPTIAVCTMESPTRFYDINANQVSCLQNQHGVNMVFSRNGRQWSYLCEEDGRTLNAQSHDGINFKKPVIYLGDYINGRKLPLVKWPGSKPMAFSQDGNWLAVGNTRGRVGLMDCLNFNKSSVVVPCHMDEVTHAVFPPDSKTLITQSRDGTIRLTSTETRKSVGKLEVDTWKKPQFLGVTPDGDVVVSIWGDTVFHWNTTTSALESYTLSGRRTREGWPIAMSADCRFLCCRTDDGVDLSDLYSGRVLYTIKFQSGFVTAADFSWDGRYLLLGKAASWMGLRVAMSTLDVWELVF
ncbi:ribosome assembly 4 [Fusarium albosuccineum]|uniref:Ribosome assembly 4 n=1 Tax=Fusarium albosuccineum TaxID=1237068 RepID=A0A8H4P7I8_9HYPO|nr:ribosome assembly 4 [Fusarium albosuccineum]